MKSKKLFKDIFTIPNILSFIRICLISVILYFFQTRNYFYVFIVLVISGLTDVLDGLIARKFSLVSTLGKIIDPIADKLTQLVVCFCLVKEYPTMFIFFMVLLIKEIIMAILGIIAIKTEIVRSSKWYGKLSTVIVFIITSIHLIYPKISSKLSLILVMISICFMIFSLIKYIIYYYRLLQDGVHTKLQ